MRNMKDKRSVLPDSQGLSGFFCLAQTNGRLSDLGGRLGSNTG